MDYFKQLIDMLNQNCNIEIISNNIIEGNTNNTFDLFRHGISDEIKYIYNNYKRFDLHWEEKNGISHGYVIFIPYEEILKEHKELCEMAEHMEADLIEEQDEVINDLSHWYPLFYFPNGDAFCYDDRNGNVVFYEHEVFDMGINLHGLLIAESIDSLFEKWSQVLFGDIYDWYEGVSELGIDLSKPVYKGLLNT